MVVTIGIAGLSGRMGRMLAEDVVTAGASLAGGTSRSGAGPDGVKLYPGISQLAAASDLVIDFTHASTVIAHAQAMTQANKGWILGTTGFDAASEAAIKAASAKIPVIAAPNFSPGVNLILALSERLGAALPAAQYDAEILEMHHRQKVDAPSGTALGIGRAIAAGRGVALDDVIVTNRNSHTGARKDGEIGFATLRGGQIIGSHSAIFTAGTEQISLTHHAFDRRIFSAGAVRAALWLAGKPPGLYTMKDVLGL